MRQPEERILLLGRTCNIPVCSSFLNVISVVARVNVRQLVEMSGLTKLYRTHIFSEVIDVVYLWFR